MLVLFSGGVANELGIQGLHGPCAERGYGTADPPLSLAAPAGIGVDSAADGAHPHPGRRHPAPAPRQG